MYRLAEERSYASSIDHALANLLAKEDDGRNAATD